MRRLRHVATFALVAIALAAPLVGDDDAHHSPAAKRQVPVDIPVVDLPYAANAPQAAPSMSQSLSISASAYELGHGAISDALASHPLVMHLTVAAADLLTTQLVPFPLSDPWLHEEWHRAVMGNRGIGSFNDIYRFELNPSSVAVSHVRDEDLVRLKRDHPAELVRLDEAGAEAELALVQRLEKSRFFHDTRGWHVALYWLAKLGVQGYIASGTSEEAETETNRWIAEEGANVKRRDFTGHDFTGWVYDLSRPDEPYQARGPHPSGVGIDRYRTPSDLTPAERAYLDRQGRLSLLNLLDSNLAGFDRFHATLAGRRLAWNATAAHMLTSFGNAVDANVFLRTDAHRLFVVLHRYSNRGHAFPGLEAQLIDEEARLAGRRVRITPRVGVWMQPRNQRFDDARAAAGGFAEARIAFPATPAFAAYLELTAKTKGWLAGQESLGRAVSLRVGVTR